MFAVILSLWSFAAGINPHDTIPDYLAHYNIPVEEHWITTDDGYILNAFRLSRPGAPVILAQHGILCSSWFMLVNEPSLSPGIQLYNQGYDVWLTNSRGNTYSTNHSTLDPYWNRKYWNFSWSDMGRFDVPANIRYILDQTGKKDLTFVGWSQGTSQFFVSMTDASVKSYVEEKVNLFVALAPVTWMAHQKSPLFKLLVGLHVDQLWETVFPVGFLTYNNTPTVAQTLCNLTAGLVCDVTVDLVAGTSKLDQWKAITNLTAHFPAGVSMKAIAHYGQLIRDGKFRDYDYGTTRNKKEYGQKTPPNFDVSKIKIPTALFVGEKDDMGDVQDTQTLHNHIKTFLHTDQVVFSKVYEEFSHMTFFLGTEDAFQAWYPDLQNLLNTYNPLPSTVAV